MENKKMTDTNGLTKAIIKADTKTLLSNGWTKEYSIMTDTTKDKEYGILFTKENKKFWYNKDTYLELKSILGGL